MPLPYPDPESAYPPDVDPGPPPMPRRIGIPTPIDIAQHILRSAQSAAQASVVAAIGRRPSTTDPLTDPSMPDALRQQYARYVNADLLGDPATRQTYERYIPGETEPTSPGLPHVAQAVMQAAKPVPARQLPALLTMPRR